MWVTADTDVTFPIRFLVDDDYVLPSSATLAIRDVTGAVIYPPSVLPTLETTHWFTLRAEFVTLPADRDFNTLFVNISYVAEGQLHQQSLQLNVIPFVPLTVTPEEVRRELGLPIQELADDQIDVVRAYFSLKRNYGAAVDTALASGTIDALRINRAVALEAALELLPSLPLRIGQKLKSEDQEFARFAGIDWDKLETRLEGELEMIMDELTGDEGAEIGVATFAWAIPTDPITGG